MAQTALLSVALLSAVLSFHGALGTSGCRISQRGLENYGLSTKNKWADALQGPIQQLPVPTLPGLVSCRFDILTCERVGVVMRPPYGVDIAVCFALQIKCFALVIPTTVRIGFCATIGLKVVPSGLNVDSCSAEYVEATVDPLISLQLPVLAEALAPVLNPVVCDHGRRIATQLNLIVALNIQSLPFPTGCQYTWARPYLPQLTNSFLDFPLAPQMYCGGVLVPWPQYPIYLPPSTLIPDGNICYYLNQDDMGNILLSLVARDFFKHQLTLTTVTTTLIMSHFSEISCPADLPAVLQLSCTGISMQFLSNTVIFDVTMRIDVGYFLSTYFSLIQITAKMRIIFYPAVDCRNGLLLFSVNAISDLEIAATCGGSPCSVPGSAIDDLFLIRTQCQDLFNARMKVGIPWPFPLNCACSTCRDVIIVPKFAMWCCDLNYLA